MVSDIYAKIREALEMRPTPGPWEWQEGQSIITREWGGKEWPIASVEQSRLGWHENRRCEGLEAGANAAYIAACDPDTIRELLAERDRLKERVAELERERDELKHDLERYISIASEEATRAEAAEARLAEARRLIRSTHKLAVTHANCEDEFCAICIGGLFICADCGATEVEAEERICTV